MAKTITSLEKGLDILSTFHSAQAALSAQAISERLYIPLSTTYRYIDTLEKRGFLTKEKDTNKYWLGIKLLQLGDIVASKMDLVDIVMPHLTSLSSLSGETILLTVVNGSDSVCIKKIDSRRVVKSSPHLGFNLPLHAGASSKILLAYQQNSFIDSFLQNAVLTKFTENTIIIPALLLRELETIRKQGFAFSDQEVDIGARAIAAPVFDHSGTLVAGITVVGPVERINDGNKPWLIQLVKEAAKRTSADLGFSGSQVGLASAGGCSARFQSTV